MKHFKPQELLDWKPDSFDDPQRAHTKSDPRFIYELVTNTDREESKLLDVLLLHTVSGTLL